MSDSFRQVTVVTDSTSDIPASLQHELGIVVVPLRILFGQESYRDGIDLSTDEFMDRLVRSETLPTTSQPSVGEFVEVFQRELDRDHDVVCVTIAAFLSGTHNSATLAARTVGGDRIAIVDSGATTMQQGWVAVAAARAAAAGANREDVRAAAIDAVDRTSVLAVLKTLDYVHRGGRIGKVGQLVGSALAIKPIITIRDRSLVPLERVRTWKKALARVEQLVNDQRDLSDIIVLYNDSRADAEAMLDVIRDGHPGANILIGRVGPVISTHAGPGAIGVATMRRA